MEMVIKRFEVWQINLDPTIGSDINKVRPCVVISPDEVNKFLKTVTIAALTHTKKNFPIRVDCYFQNQHGQICLDQIRSIDKSQARFVQKLGVIDTATSMQVCKTLQDLFEY
jgi:mRNA interferase MazF